MSFYSGLSFYRATQKFFPKRLDARLLALGGSCLFIPLMTMCLYTIITGKGDNTLLLLVFAASIAGFVALAAMIRFMLQPLDLVLDMMDSFARNRTFPTCPVKSDDQVGRLFSFFERLAWKVENLVAELEAIAVTDDLTGLMNRRMFMQRMKEMLAQARRGKMTFSLAMIDIDHFKQINNLCGASLGDSILRDIGSLLRNSIREYDLPARWEGQEFILLMPATTLEEARTACERLREKVARMSPVMPEQEPMTLSFGITSFDITDLHADDVIRRADLLVRQAKNKGRNRIETVLDEGVLKDKVSAKGSAKSSAKSSAKTLLLEHNS